MDAERRLLHRRSTALTWLAGSGEALTSGTDAARFQTLNGGVKPSDAPTLDCAAKRERGAFSGLAFSINNKSPRPAAGLSRL
jgi:hypothetical protein